MNAEKDIMGQVKTCARAFMKKEYPSEAPFFSIAWDVFEKALQNSAHKNRGKTLTVKDLKRPAVRNGKRSSSSEKLDSATIIAPLVIKAFHLLFTVQEPESGLNKETRQELVQLLSQNKFSPQFSAEIVDFFLENKEKL